MANLSGFMAFLVPEYMGIGLGYCGGRSVGFY